MAATKLANNNVPSCGIQPGTVVMAPTIGFLLKQVYALHKDIVHDLENQILQLTQNLSESQQRNGKLLSTTSEASCSVAHENKRGETSRSYKRRRLASQVEDLSDVSEQEKDGCVLVSDTNESERKQPYRSLQRRRVVKARSHDGVTQNYTEKLETEAVGTGKMTEQPNNYNCEYTNNKIDSEILVLDTLNVFDTDNCVIVAETLDGDICDLYAVDADRERAGKSRLESEKVSCAQNKKQVKPLHATDSVRKGKNRSVSSPILFLEDVETADNDFIGQYSTEGNEKLAERVIGSKKEIMKSPELGKNKLERNRKAGLSKNDKVDTSVLKSLNGQVEIVTEDGKEKKHVKSKKKQGSYVIEFDPNAKTVNSTKLKQTIITKESFNPLLKPKPRNASSSDEVPVNAEMEEKWLQEALKKSLLQNEECKHASSSNKEGDSESSDSSADSFSLLNPNVVESAANVIPLSNNRAGMKNGEERRVKQNSKIDKLTADSCKLSAKGEATKSCLLPPKSLNSTAASSFSSPAGDNSLDETCLGSPTLLGNANALQRFKTRTLNNDQPLCVVGTNRVSEEPDGNLNDDTLDETCGPSQLLMEIGLPDVEKVPQCNGSLDPYVRLSEYETCAFNEDEGRINAASTSKEISEKQTSKNKTTDKREELANFDRVPKKAAVDYKYKEVPIRNRDERKKLEGFACKCCREYYEALDLSEEEIKKRMKDCSRHRDRQAPPNTPDHYWSIGFPDTQECKARGYIQPTQVRPLRRRQKTNLLDGSIIPVPDDDSFLS